MNGKHISDALSQVDMSLIEESDPTCQKPKKQRPYWIIPIAASVAVFVIVALLYKGGRLEITKPKVDVTATSATEATTSAVPETSTPDYVEEDEKYLSTVKPYSLALQHYPAYPKYSKESAEKI